MAVPRMRAHHIVNVAALASIGVVVFEPHSVECEGPWM